MLTRIEFKIKNVKIKINYQSGTQASGMQWREASSICRLLNILDCSRNPRRQDACAPD
jgi:hypothetical protein